VTATVLIPDGNKEGQTHYTYVDKNATKTIVYNTRLQWPTFNDFSEQRCGSGENSTANSDTLGKLDSSVSLLIHLLTSRK